MFSFFKRASKKDAKSTAATHGRRNSANDKSSDKNKPVENEEPTETNLKSGNVTEEPAEDLSEDDSPRIMSPMAAFRSKGKNKRRNYQQKNKNVTNKTSLVKSQGANNGANLKLDNTAKSNSDRSQISDITNPKFSENLNSSATSSKHELQKSQSLNPNEFTSINNHEKLHKTTSLNPLHFENDSTLPKNSHKKSSSNDKRSKTNKSLTLSNDELKSSNLSNKNSSSLAKSESTCSNTNTFVNDTVHGAIKLQIDLPEVIKRSKNTTKDVTESGSGGAKPKVEANHVNHVSVQNEKKQDNINHKTENSNSVSSIENGINGTTSENINVQTSPTQTLILNDEVLKDLIQKLDPNVIHILNHAPSHENINIESTNVLVLPNETSNENLITVEVKATEMGNTSSEHEQNENNDNLIKSDALNGEINNVSNIEINELRSKEIQTIALEKESKTNERIENGALKLTPVNGEDRTHINDIENVSNVEVFGSSQSTVDISHETVDGTTFNLTSADSLPKTDTNEVTNIEINHGMYPHKDTVSDKEIQHPQEISLELSPDKIKDVNLDTTNTQVAQQNTELITTPSDVTDKQTINKELINTVQTHEHNSLEGVSVSKNENKEGDYLNTEVLKENRSRQSDDTGAHIEAKEEVIVNHNSSNESKPNEILTTASNNLPNNLNMVYNNEILTNDLGRSDSGSDIVKVDEQMETLVNSDNADTCDKEALDSQNEEAGNENIASEDGKYVLLFYLLFIVSPLSINYCGFIYHRMFYN